MSDLPVGWALAQLGELGRWGSGGTPSRSKQEYFGPGTPWVKTGDLKDQLIDFVPESITVEGLANSAAKVFPPGTLLVAMYGATIGQSGVLTIHAATNQACAALISEGVTAQLIPYVWKYLLSIKEELRSAGQGGAQPNISQEILKAFGVPMAPLAEQRRIVAKLDALTARTARARADLDRLPDLAERYKQAALAQIFTANSSDARAVSINDVVEQIFDGPFGSHLKSDDYVDAGVRVVRLENIGHLNFVEEKRTYISPEKYAGLQRHTLAVEDVLFSSFVAEQIRVSVMPDLHTPAINKADCFCIRVNRQRIDPNFLAYRLACGSTYETFKDMVHGATRPRINLTQLRSFMLDLPSMAIQHKVVAQVRAAFTEIDRLVAEAAAARRQLDRLDQAILAKAFRGELVPQDPADEPASALLDRIRAERAASPVKLRRGRPAAA